MRRSESTDFLKSTFSIFIPKRKIAVPVPWELIDNYSRESTIHGMKYLGEKKQHWAERIFWVSIFIVSITLCAKNMRDLYEKRQEKPVMISLSKDLTPTYDIPFPAVTICAEMKSKCDQINMTEIITNFKANHSREVIRKISALSHICEQSLHHENIQKITRELVYDSNTINILEELGYTSVEIFDECRFNSWKYESCDKYLIKTITDAGICYTFNMLNSNDLIKESAMHPDLHHPKHENKSSWFLEKDYNSPYVNVYPRRVLGAGVQSGLSVKFRFNASMLCPSNMSRRKGFRVALHMPVEQSLISKTFYNVPFNHETNLIVKPSMIYSSKDIKIYEPKKRLCYFNDERQLKYFRIYSKSNCDLECKADYVERKCGCVKFSMPRSNETVVCGNAQLECVYEAELNYTVQELQKRLMEKQLKRDIKHGKATKDDFRYKALKQMKSCDCLESCASISYNVEISQTDYELNENGFIGASLNIFFKEAEFNRLKRYEIYGWTEYLSNSGGILGLFMGCSVLSFIEIFYHVVLYCIKKCRKRKLEINNPKDISEERY